MGSVGKVAFVAILGLGAITGVLVYYIFGNAAPAPGVIESIYRQNLPATDGATQDTSQSSSEGANSTSANSTSAAPVAPPSAASGNQTNQTSSAAGPSVTLNILEGASVQGNPAYDPDPLSVTAGDVVEVSNQDTVPHTATSGSGPEDPESGSQFDTSIIDAGATAQIDTASLAAGDHPFYCSVHPYMLGSMTVK
ncbi:MAG: cupredoxin domain-containing protein [Nitrososphaeraceae archaeon]